MIKKYVKDLLPDKYKNKITLDKFKNNRKKSNIDIEKIIFEERYGKVKE